MVVPRREVPGVGAGPPHAGEGDEAGLAASLLTVIPDPGAGVRARPHGTGAGATHAGEGDQGRVLWPTSLI